jgi:hypothetical protein
MSHTPGQKNTNTHIAVNHVWGGLTGANRKAVDKRATQDSVVVVGRPDTAQDRRYTDGRVLQMINTAAGSNRLSYELHVHATGALELQIPVPLFARL